MIIATTFKAIGTAAHAVQTYVLAMAQNWWRPFAEWSIGLSIFVSGVYLPLHNHVAPDLGTLAALVASATGFVAARSWEKVKGAQDVEASE